MKDKKENVHFLINPISGSGNKKNIENKILEYFKENSSRVNISHTRESGNREHLAKVLQEEKPDILAVAGGDGTVNMAGSMLIGKETKLGIIPMGSANGLATSVGIPKNIEDALNIISSGKTRTIDAIRVNDSISFHISDFGLNANVIKRFEEDEQRGLLGYLKHFLAELFKVKGHKYKIEFEEEVLKTKASMIFISNATQFGTGATINPTGKIDDGKFEIIIVKSYKTRILLRKIIKFLRGRINHTDFVEIISTRKARIHNTNNRVFQIDGELAGRPDKVELAIIPGSIRLLVKEG